MVPPIRHGVFLLLLVPAALAIQWPYILKDNFAGSGFLDAFYNEAIWDPTNGRVTYVDRATSLAHNLTFASDSGSSSGSSIFPWHPDHDASTFILRADHTTTLTPDGPGRESVRLRSKKAFGEGVYIFNVRHMPEGCGTWPAIWSFGDPWPYKGEIDLVENVNNAEYNLITLHTATNCTMPTKRPETDTAMLNDCNTASSSNAGCGVQSRDPRSFGPAFNANGGGWFAMERTRSYVKAWFWARDSPGVPLDVRFDAKVVFPGFWGTPAAYFPTTETCDIDESFGDHNIVINLTFCGDWAGNVYADSGCPSTCIEYVESNPGAFADAYFDLAWLRVYETI